MTDSHLKAFSEAMDRIFDAFEHRQPKKRVSARQLECWFTLPGSDCRLRVDVDFDEHGVPTLNDVCDATGERFPFEQVWFAGKPLEDLLIEWLCNTPADELRRV